MKSLNEAFDLLKEYYLQKIEEIKEEQEKLKEQYTSDNNKEVEEAEQY